MHFEFWALHFMCTSDFLKIFYVFDLNIKFLPAIIIRKNFALGESNAKEIISHYYLTLPLPF